MVSCFIINAIVLLVVKISSSICNLSYHERNAQQYYSIFGNAVGYELASLLCYQLLYFCYCVNCRYKVLIGCFREHFKNTCKIRHRMDDNWLEELVLLHATIAKVIRIVNEVFSGMVKTFILCVWIFHLYKIHYFTAHSIFVSHIDRKHQHILHFFEDTHEEKHRVIFVFDFNIWL